VAGAAAEEIKPPRRIRAEDGFCISTARGWRTARRGLNARRSASKVAEVGRRPIIRGLGLIAAARFLKGISRKGMSYPWTPK
jgi:hypothetical protein